MGLPGLFPQICGIIPPTAAKYDVMIFIFDQHYTGLLYYKIAKLEIKRLNKLLYNVLVHSSNDSKKENIPNNNVTYV